MLATSGRYLAHHLRNIDFYSSGRPHMHEDFADVGTGFRMLAALSLMC